MDLTLFEDGDFEYEIGFYISQLQEFQNCNWKIEKWRKINSSVQIYDQHICFKFFDKNRYIPYFEYGESDFDLIEISSDLLAHLMRQKQP